MLYLRATAVSVSKLIRPTESRFSYCFSIDSSAGASARQYPHHGAQNFTKTGFLVFNTSSRKLSVVIALIAISRSFPGASRQFFCLLPIFCSLSSAACSNAFSGNNTTPDKMPMLAPSVTATWNSVMSARSPNRMLLSHPSTSPATARIAIRRHPRMILFLAVASVRPNSLLSLCLIYISTLPANAVLVKKPPIKCLQTCQFNHDRSEGQAQVSSSAAPAGILVICMQKYRGKL